MSQSLVLHNSSLVHFISSFILYHDPTHKHNVLQRIWLRRTCWTWHKAIEEQEWPVGCRVYANLTRKVAFEWGIYYPVAHFYTSCLLYNSYPRVFDKLPSLLVSKISCLQVESNISCVFNVPDAVRRIMMENLDVGVLTKILLINIPIPHRDWKWVRTLKFHPGAEIQLSNWSNGLSFNYYPRMKECSFDGGSPRQHFSVGDSSTHMTREDVHNAMVNWLCTGQYPQIQES